MREVVVKVASEALLLLSQTLSDLYLFRAWSLIPPSGGNPKGLRAWNRGCLLKFIN